MKKVALATMCLLSLFMFLPSVSAARPTPAAVTLYDSFGQVWTLNVKGAKVKFLYGNVAIPDYGTFPAYGFVMGNEMVLWCNIAELGPGYADSFAYTGVWDFATYTYTGTTISYEAETGYYWALTVQMWLSLSGEVKAGPSPLTKQTSGLQAGVSPSGMNPRGDVHAAATFQDSYGYMWYLNERAFMGDIIYYGELDAGGGLVCPAYGYHDGSEMFLWCNAPGDPYPDSFVYIGMWSGGTFYGAWVNYYAGGGNYGPVTLWYA